MNEELAKFEKRPRPQRRTRRSLGLGCRGLGGGEGGGKGGEEGGGLGGGEGGDEGGGRGGRGLSADACRRARWRAPASNFLAFYPQNSVNNNNNTRLG